MRETMRILIVDDEKVVRESFLHWFAKAGHRVEAAASGSEALSILERTPIDLMFADIKMPGMDGIRLLEKVRAEYPETMVVIITAYGSIESAIRAMKLGASDYLLKPFKPDQLSLVLEKTQQQKKMASKYHYLRGCLEKITRFDNIIGQSQAMRQLFAMIPEVARADTTVLICGETGTGKELIARAIHAKSPRSHLPFVAINCGAVPDTLLESELFGHQKGAYTGAVHARKGYLEVVCGGTLFLDEIGEISPKMQIDLLRVIEEKKITRLGSREPTPVDFRLISATRRNLEERIQNGHFRSDFYYRINVIQMPVPPLRSRKEDIEPLVHHFLEKYSQETAKKVDRISARGLNLLKRYDWPGNVRELENAVERAVVLAQSRTLDCQDFSFLQSSPPASARTPTLQELEEDYIRQMLAENDWNITRTSAILGINRVTLHKKLKRMGLQRSTVSPS